MTTPSEPHVDRVVVDIWSDVMCPFCYIGDTVLARAVEQFEHPVEVRYHSYLLAPELPEGRTQPLNQMLAAHKGVSVEQAAQINRMVSARAADEGLIFDTDSARATGTRTAHRLIHHASTHGLGHPMALRLFKAYFSDGLDVGDHEVLAALAAEVGLNRDGALETLRSSAHAEDVDADVEMARQIGITGVPFFVLDGRYAVQRAQPAEAFRHALATAWADHEGDGVGRSRGRRRGLRPSAPRSRQATKTQKGWQAGSANT